MKDFFISYNKADREWAEWIAWTLEEAGYRVVIQAWDFRPGDNFVLKMQNATAECEKTIAVLSDNYLKAEFTQPEWAVAFAKDARGEKRALVPMRVSECKPPGLLEIINYVDLVGLPEDDARVAVLGAFSARAKPARAPEFPRKKSKKSATRKKAKKPYPGAASHSKTSYIADTLIRPDRKEYVRQTEVSVSTATDERLRLAKKLSAIPPQQFNIILFALNPPPGLIPSMPAPQMDRSNHLLLWAESPDGCGIKELQRVMQQISGSPLPPSQESDFLPQPFQPVSSMRVAELSAIIGNGNFTETLLKQSYYASSPSVTPVPEEHRRSVSETLFFCLDRLSKMACRVPDSAPLLEFVDRLTPHLEDATARTRVANWMAQVAQELGIDIDQLRMRAGQVKSVAAEAVGDPYLLIKVEQSHWDTSQFEVKAWLLYANEYHPLRAGEGVYAFDGIPELLGKLIEESQEHLLSLVGDNEEILAELIIEIFLPTGKLECEAHTWEVAVGLGTTRPVGTLYRVAVRSFERTYHKAYRLYPRAIWRQKWQTRPRSLREMTDLEICWACSDEDLCENLFDRLKKTGLIFIALTPISSDEAVDAPGILQTLLDAGTAIALWPKHRPQDVATAREDVSALVYNQVLDMMPHAVFTKRENTMLGENSIWSFLTLLWDDPDRLPPDVKFQKLRAPN